MRWSCFFICLGLTAGPSAQAGVGQVETLDGATLSGELVLSNNVLIVTASNVPGILVGITNLRTAKFNLPRDAAGVTAGGQGHGLLGYYFSNTNLHGYAGVRLDESVDFDWGTAEPPPGIPGDRFSVVWSGEVEAPATGDFNFTVEAGDRGRLYVADRLVAEAGEHREVPEN